MSADAAPWRNTRTGERGTVVLEIRRGANTLSHPGSARSEKSRTTHETVGIGVPATPTERRQPRSSQPGTVPVTRLRGWRHRSGSLARRSWPEDAALCTYVRGGTMAAAERGDDREERTARTTVRPTAVGNTHR